MKQCVRIYIEGGAEGRTADSDFRRGWKQFLREMHNLARDHGYHSLEVVRGKGRGNAFRRFVHHKMEHPNDLCFLLVDAEGPVGSKELVWNVVGRRIGDQWKRPKWATEDDLYLMVQFVETWLVADPEALAEFFKRGFDPTGLPATNLEGRTKAQIEAALANATRTCGKGPYQHGQAHEVIGLVRPEKIKELRHGKRFFDGLSARIKQGY